MSVIARYLIGRYFAVFAYVAGFAAAVYLIVHFFDRIDVITRHDPPLAAVASYFVFRVPKMIADVFPATALLALLLSVGLSVRDRELVALSAGGVAPWRIARPVLAAALLLSMGALAWNEFVVPASMQRSRYLYDIVIKQKTDRGSHDATSVWFQHPRGMVHIDFYDAASQAVHGLTIFETDSAHALRRVIEVPSLAWSEDGWRTTEGTVRLLDGQTVETRALDAAAFVFDERPDELARRRRHSDEFRFAQLRQQISNLQDKGLDAGEFEVDLHQKIALPMAGFVLALVGFPLALRRSRRGGLAANTATGLAVGFVYFAVAGVCASFGRTGATPALLAAWLPNLLFALAGAMLFSRRDVG